MSQSIATTALESFWTTTRTVACIGRNYAAHAKEMKSATPTQPFFFLKPASSILAVPKQSSGTILLPRFVGAIHHEVELAVVIGSTARHVKEADAMRHVAGYALSVDVTARDLQSAAKDAGMPWSRAKGYDTFCPVGSFIPASRVPNPHALRLTFAINGAVKQDGVTSDMIFSIPKLIAHISSIMTLSPCDIILTGTPEGVGPIKHGDKIVAQLFDGATNAELQTIKLDAREDTSE
jgi:acylpyruvate hydrolase